MAQPVNNFSKDFIKFCDEREALEKFFDKIRSFNLKNIYVALSGGRSLLSFYEKIVEYSSELDEEIWKKIIFCLADERLVQLDNDLSNYKLICNRLYGLIEKGLIEHKQIVAVDVNHSHPAEDYNSKIPRVDIVLLGAGEDSHVASLFPNHASIRNEYEGYILVENSPKPPSLRVSMTKKMIDRCSVSFVFFMGHEKLNAYNCFIRNSGNIEFCPSAIAKESTECYVVTNLDCDE